MLNIVVNNAHSSSHMWHRGETFPLPFDYIHMVTEIQADGDELLLIDQFCRNIPEYYTGRVVRYFGDHARFICGVMLSQSKKKSGSSE